VRWIVLYRGGSAFMFAGASKSSRGTIPEADGLFKSVAQTMRSLKPAEFPLAEPYRIRIMQATETTDLTAYAAEVPVEKYQKEELLLMNGLYPDKKLQSGDALQGGRVVHGLSPALPPRLDFGSREVSTSAATTGIREIMANKKFELTDVASGKKDALPLKSGTIGPDVVDIAALNKEFGVFTFDPGFMATASTESKITYIDGDAGVLLYRGYPIEQLAEKSSFLEVAYLLLNGELPNPKRSSPSSRPTSSTTR
jgi:hypothetical protein